MPPPASANIVYGIAAAVASTPTSTKPRWLENTIQNTYRRLNRLPGGKNRTPPYDFNPFAARAALPCSKPPSSVSFI